MALNVITALRQHAGTCGLKGSYKLTALELCHRLSSSGVGRASYRFLAWKTGMSPRTMIRHIARLVEMGLITKHVHRHLDHGKLVCGWNEYRVTFSVEVQSRTAPQRGGSDNLAKTLPDPKTDQEKCTSIREEIQKHEKALRLFSMPREAREQVEQEIVRLKGLIPTATALAGR